MIKIIVLGLRQKYNRFCDNLSHIIGKNFFQTTNIEAQYVADEAIDIYEIYVFE